MEKFYNVYIASDKPYGGIYHYRLLGGELKFVDKAPAIRPQYLCIFQNKLYALLRDEDNNGSLMSFDIAEDGTISNPTAPLSTRGKVPCHMCCLDGEVYVANYTSGSVIKMPDKLVCHEGSSINSSRQGEPHTHFVYPTPDNKYLAVADLGTDEIMVYDKAMEVISKLSVTAGDGPRHLCYSDDGKTVFCANELGSSVSVLGYNDGVFTLKGTYKTLFEDIEENFPSAIRFDKKLYVSNRGDDSISVFAVDGEKLELESVVKTGGKWPRDFCIFGDTLICANQLGDTVTLFDKSTGGIVQTGEISIPTPICVVGF